MKNDKAVGKQSQYPLLHEADTQSNSAWWLWRSTWMGCKAAWFVILYLESGRRGKNEVSVAVDDDLGASVA